MATRPPEVAALTHFLEQRQVLANAERVVSAERTRCEGERHTWEAFNSCDASDSREPCKARML